MESNFIGILGQLQGSLLSNLGYSSYTQIIPLFNLGHSSYTQSVFCGTLGFREAFLGVPPKLVLIIINKILNKPP